ncbi:MAG: asparaginase [Bacteroidia bacterium]|nr:asparaginase [Bacteroidia bacterium]
MPSPNPILVNSFRGSVLESYHRGVVCVVDSDNNIIYSEGDVTQVCFPRSAMKMFQQIPLLTSGAFEELGITEEEVAIFCGSHNGETIHRAVAEKVLHRAGLTQDALCCGPQAPTLKEDVAEMYRAGGVPQRIHNNCSGKHAGFLLYCHYKGYSIDDYFSPEHPMQKEIKTVCSQFYEYPESSMETAIDGCTTPIYSIPVFNQAVGYKNLVHPVNFDESTQKACDIIVRSVAKYPYLLAGKKRYCTDLMQVAGDRLIGKTGADGVYCIGLRNKAIGICIKIDDGRMGPQYIVAEKLLENSGIINQDEVGTLAQYSCETQRNWGGVAIGTLEVDKGVALKF